MSNITRIENLHSKNENLEKQYNEYLKEMTKQGSLFLEKYSYGENPPLLLFVGEKICDDLKISLKPTGRNELTTYKVYKKCIGTEDTKYSFYYPEDISYADRNVGLAYAIGIIIFDKFFLDLPYQFAEFEFPNNFSINLNFGELAFIYSLILPYPTYKKYLIEFLNQEYKFKDNNEWLDYLLGQIPCSKYIASVISTFYSTIYYEELNKIWSDYCNKWEDIYFCDQSYCLRRP